MFNGLGQSALSTCQTPYFGPYGMSSGSPCSYMDGDGCCDPSGTTFGSGGSATPWWQLPGAVNVVPGGPGANTRTCDTPFYSKMFGSLKLYQDAQGYCDPTLTDVGNGAGGGFKLDSQTFMIIGGILALIMVMSGGGGGGTRRRR